MSLLVHRPDGAIGTHALDLTRVPEVLAGVAIGVLDNTKPNAGVLLDRLAERLAERTGAVVTRRDTKNAALPADDQVLDGITREVKIVLTGSAD